MRVSEANGAPGTTGLPAPAPQASAAAALARCIGVPVGEFAERYWDSAPLLSPGAGPGEFADLFSTAAVDELVSERGLRTPFLRMAKDGSVLATTDFTRSGGTGAGIADQVADDKVLAQLAGGSTLVLQALHRTWPPLIDFGGRLASELGHPVQINAYITPPQNQGFSAHYDTHDVFVLQVAGTKQWRIHRPVLEHPLPDQTWDRRRPQVAARAAESPLIDTVLRPGDALYLPRGFLHSAVAQGEVSIHLTVGVHPITGYDLARRLVRLLASDPELRRSLPLGASATGTPALTTHVAAAAVRVGRAVDEARPEQFVTIADQVSRQLAGDTRPAPLRPLAQLAAIADLSGDTAVRLRPGLRPRVRRTGESVVLDVIDSSIRLPIATAGAIDAIVSDAAVSGAATTPDALPGLESDERLVLVRRLLREGVLVPAVPVDGG